MQLLPSTAADMVLTDLLVRRENLHAGIKYMDCLREKLFDEPQLEPAVQVEVALAVHSAGPGNVRHWRAAAPERGLGPDRWFGNVELIGLEVAGMQLVQDASNLHKDFVWLTLMRNELRARGGAELEATAR